MLLSVSGIQHPESVKNIIFDFGGVLCNLDVQKTEKKFIELGMTRPDTKEGEQERNALFGKIEDGSLSSQDFRNALQKYFQKTVSDHEIDEAWNALLLDIPEPRIRFLEKIKNHYRIFLLSNSNEIHYLKYLDTFKRQFGYPGFDALFEKAYFSFQIKMKKPGREIFDYVIRESSLVPGETLFIDDTLRHVEGARAAGLQACHLQIQKGEQIMDLFQAE